MHIKRKSKWQRPKHVQNTSNLPTQINLYMVLHLTSSKKKKSYEMLLIFIFLCFFLLLEIYKQEAFLSSYSEV